MSKHKQAAELANSLLAAAKNDPGAPSLDQNWENQVMRQVLSQGSAQQSRPARAVYREYLPSLSSIGALACGLTLVACYKLDAIDAHILKATVENTFNFSTGLFHLL